MFKALTYKTKNQLLVAAMVVLAFLIYFFAIKKTREAYKQYTVVKDKITLATGLPAMIIQLENEIKKMDVKIGNQNTTGANTEQALLELLTTYCQKNHAVLREFPQATADKQGNLLVETNAFVVEGNFITLLNLVYALEQKSKLGKVAAVRYQLKKNIKTADMVLTVKVYIQNIKKQMI